MVTRSEVDLDANWEVLAEPIQSAMRAAAIAGVPGMDNPYETLRALTRGRRIGADDVRTFVAGLGLPADATERLIALTPPPTSAWPRNWSTSTSRDTILLPARHSAGVSSRPLVSDCWCATLENLGGSN